MMAGKSHLAWSSCIAFGFLTIMSCAFSFNLQHAWRRPSLLRRAVAANTLVELKPATTLPDNRTYRILADDSELAAHLKSIVAEVAMASIAERGSFALSIGSGTTVSPLAGLAQVEGMDFSKWHIFFGNERTTGESAYKCFRGAAAFVDACGIPAVNVHKVPDGGGDPAASAAEYDALLRRKLGLGDMEGTDPSALPRLDLVLLGSGADGHCASLYPGSAQVLMSPQSMSGPRTSVAVAEGKGGVTLTLDFIMEARKVLVSAGKAAQTDMVSVALGQGDTSSHGLPVGMIAAGERTSVEWLLTEASAASLVHSLSQAGDGSGNGDDDRGSGGLTGLDAVVDALAFEERQTQRELEDAIETLRLQQELARELGYDSVAEFEAAMEEVESDIGLEAFLAEIEEEMDTEEL